MSHRRQIVVSLGPGYENALRFVRFRHPDSILLVVPTNLKTHEDAFSVQLRRLACDSVEVCPYDFNSTRLHLRNALRHQGARTVEICVSSGPLAVRTAAMQLARDSGYRASHVTFQKCLRIYDAFRPQDPPEVAHNSLARYLAARGIRMGTRYPLAKAPYIEVAEYLLAHRNVWVKVITLLRPLALAPSTGHKTVSISRSRLQKNHLDILRQLKECQIITALDCRRDQVTIHIPDNNWNFLNGHWLEVLVFHRLADLFEDSSCGQQLETASGIQEIDFIGLRDGHLTLVSCKTSAHSYKLAHLKELQSLSQQIGEPDCLRIYVTDHLPHAPRQPGLDNKDFLALPMTELLR